MKVGLLKKVKETTRTEIKEDPFIYCSTETIPSSLDHTVR